MACCPTSSPSLPLKVRVPHPVNELCSRDVLVMEYLHGVKLVDAIRDFYTRVAQSRYVADCKCRVGQILRCEFQQRWYLVPHVFQHLLRMMRPRNMTLDELQEEYRRLGKTPPPEWEMDQYQWTEWGKVKSYNSLATVYNWTLGWVAPNLHYSEYGTSEINAAGWVSSFLQSSLRSSKEPCLSHHVCVPSFRFIPGRVLNVPRILRQLFDVHGHQILVDGTVDLCRHWADG